MYIIRHFEAPLINSNRVRGQILSHMQQLQRELLKLFESTVATWNHEVKFESNVYYASGNAIIDVTTDDKIWDYLDGGTNVRHAKMEKGFQPKTSVRTWGSVAGQGTKESVSWKMNFKGITARDWTLMAETEYGKKLEQALDDAIDAGLGLFL